MTQKGREAKVEGSKEKGSPPRLSPGVRQLEGGNRLNGMASPDRAGALLLPWRQSPRAPSSPPTGSQLLRPQTSPYCPPVARDSLAPGFTESILETNTGLAFCYRLGKLETKEGLASSSTRNSERAKVELRACVPYITPRVLQGGLVDGN